MSSPLVATHPVVFGFTILQSVLSMPKSFFRSEKSVYHFFLSFVFKQYLTHFSRFQAFIQVLGVHGIFVDKCQVFPASATSHTTVPLTNNSEIEINKKRFRFDYPPKALRPILAFTPRPNVSKSARKRVLRLSMIQSAQVFTPRPDPDPRVNLRVLQTPIRLNSSPLKHAHQTPPRQVHADRLEEECGTPIRLVEGNRPQVVEEEQDLVILEEVDAPQHISQPNSLNTQINPVQSPAQAPHMSGPYQAPALPLSSPHQSQQFQTPRRRLGRPSLHRAVLIRSAQRAAMRIEMENEQDEEEREVEEHVIPIEEQMEVDEENHRDQDANVLDDFDEEAHDDGDGEDPGMDPEPTTPVLGWRMGLEAFKSGLQVLRSRSESPEKNQYAEGDVAEVRTTLNTRKLLSDRFFLRYRCALLVMMTNIMFAPSVTTEITWIKMKGCKTPKMKRSRVKIPTNVKLGLKASLEPGLSQCLVNSPLNVQRGR